jgi:hypothetical protein
MKEAKQQRLRRTGERGIDDDWRDDKKEKMKQRRTESAEEGNLRGDSKRLGIEHPPTKRTYVQYTTLMS